jgi:hypothetical protein
LSAVRDFLVRLLTRFAPGSREENSNPRVRLQGINPLIRLKRPRSLGLPKRRRNADLDETGDHTLESLDKDFPVFALCMFICNTEHRKTSWEPRLLILLPIRSREQSLIRESGTAHSRR